MSQNENNSISETRPPGRKRSNTKHKLPAVHSPLSKQALANTGYQEQVIESTDKAKGLEIGEAMRPSHERRSSGDDVCDKAESRSEDGWKLIDMPQNGRNAKVVPFLSKSQSLVSREPAVERENQCANLPTLDLRTIGHTMPPLTDAGKKALAEQANLLSQVPVRQNEPQIEDGSDIPTTDGADDESTGSQSTLALSTDGIGTEEYAVTCAPNMVSNPIDDSIAQSSVAENNVGSEEILQTDNYPVSCSAARPNELCASASSSITGSQITENIKSTTFSEVIKMLVAVIDKEFEVTSRQGSEAFSRRDLALASSSLKKSTKLSEFRQVAVSLLQEYSQAIANKLDNNALI